MSGETLMTIVGNLTADPELRYTQSGLAVVNFTVASTPREFDSQTNQMKDGEALFLRASVWREHAENVSASLRKGMRVIVQGRLRQRRYETEGGEKRTTFELDVVEIGPALRWQTAQVARAAAGSSPSSGQQPAGNMWPDPPSAPSEPWSDDTPF